MLPTLLLNFVDSQSSQGTALRLFAGRGQKEGTGCLKVPVGNIQEKPFAWSWTCISESLMSEADFYGEKKGHAQFLKSSWSSGLPFLILSEHTSRESWPRNHSKLDFFFYNTHPKSLMKEFSTLKKPRLSLWKTSYRHFPVFPILSKFGKCRNDIRPTHCK